MIATNKATIGLGLGLVVVAALGIWWVTRTGAAKDAGAAVGGAVIGAIAGAAGAVLSGVNDFVGTPTTTQLIAAANDPTKNPLQPVGAWLGSTIYDITSAIP